MGNVALVCESQIKGLVEGMDLGLVSLHMKGMPWQSPLLSERMAGLGRGQFLS